MEQVFSLPPCPLGERGQPTQIQVKGDSVVYAAGHCAVVRSLDDVGKVDLYKGHPFPVSAAALSPSGAVLATGDQRGNMKIFDTVTPDHPMTAEAQAISGKVRNIAFTKDSQRVVLVGEGKGAVGSVMQLDGKHVGDIGRHTAAINSVVISPIEPHSAFTASDDKSVVVHKGPGFDTTTAITGAHSNFVYSVDSTVDGKLIASGGGDKAVVFYNGPEPEAPAATLATAHKGSVFALSFSPDAQILLTASGDKTLRVIDATDPAAATVEGSYSFATGEAAGEFPAPPVPCDGSITGWGAGPAGQVVGCGWSTKGPVALTLCGDVVVMAEKGPHTVLRGHTKNVNCVVPDGTGGFFSGASDGSVLRWTKGEGASAFKAARVAYPYEMRGMKDRGHTSAVKQMVVSGEFMITGGSASDLDGTVRSVCLKTTQYTEESLALPGGTLDLAVSGKYVFAIGHEAVYRVSVGAAGELTLAGEPLKTPAAAICIAAGGSTIVVGLKNGTVLSVDADPFAIKDTYTPPNCAAGISCVAVSCDGCTIAVGESNRAMAIAKVADGAKEWTSIIAHNQQPKSLLFAKEGSVLVSVGVDGMVALSDPAKGAVIHRAERAHGISATGVAMVGDTLLTCGADGIIIGWKLK